MKYTIHFFLPPSAEGVQPASAGNPSGEFSDLNDAIAIAQKSAGPLGNGATSFQIVDEEDQTVAIQILTGTSWAPKDG